MSLVDKTCLNVITEHTSHWLGPHSKGDHVFEAGDVPPSLKHKVPTTKPHPHHKPLRIGVLHISALKAFDDILRQMYPNLGMISFQVASFIFT